jgi:hypothetical protein
MDQNKSETPVSGTPNFRQFNPPVARRQTFAVPTERAFNATPRPSTPESLTQPVASVPPQPRSFEPPAPVVAAPEPKTSPKLKLPNLSSKQKVASGVTGLLLIVGLGFVGHSVLTQPQSGLKPHGRKITVAEPTVADKYLQASCYSLTMPEQYQLTHSAGCVNEINSPKGDTKSAIFIASNPAATALTLKEAPAVFQEQLKLLGKDLNIFQTTQTSVNGLPALKVIYQLGDDPEQVMVYVPDLPAQYISGKEAAGAFMIRAYYDDSTQQANFDSTLRSLKWTK